MWLCQQLSNNCFLFFVVNFVSVYFCNITAFRPKIFLWFFWQLCFITSLINCCSHSTELVYPLSVLAINGTLSTLRFFLRDVSQLWQGRACPNTGCGLLCGKMIGLFTASHHVNPRCLFHCVWWPQSNFLLLHLFLHFDPCVHADDWDDVSWLAWSLFNTSLTTMGFVLYSFVLLYRCLPDILTPSHKRVILCDSPGSGGSGIELWSCESCVRNSWRWCCSSSSH